MLTYVKYAAVLPAATSHQTIIFREFREIKEFREIREFREFKEIREISV